MKIQNTVLYKRGIRKQPKCAIPIIIPISNYLFFVVISTVNKSREIKYSLNRTLVETKQLKPKRRIRLRIGHAKVSRAEWEKPIRPSCDTFYT